MPEDVNPRSLRVASWLSLIVAVMAAVAPYAAATVWANGMKAIIYDFDAEAPAATLAFFQIPSLLWTVLVLLVVISLVAKELFVSRTFVKLGINLVSAAVMLAAAFCIFFVLFLPLWRLIEKLSSSE